MTAHVDAAARCKDCARPPEPARARCAECAARHRETEAARRRARAEAGRCVVCGAPTVKSRATGEWVVTTMCGQHLRYYAERAAAAKAG